MLTVWGRTNSINVQKVLWTLVEVRREFTRVDAGLQFGVTQTPEYLAMNPNALVPTIDDDGFVLWESNVIVRYLASKYGPEALYPRGLEERALVERWMDWQTNTFYPAMVPAFMGLVRQSPGERDDAAIEKARAAAERWLTILDRHLASRDFVNGDAFTVGEIPIGAAVNRWYRMPIARQDHKNVEHWLAALRERPGFRSHVDLPLS